ncbi:MAG: hypothetical protein K8S98_00915 [Planctomycetes bacterium]|nr:hypothetical protein [Planctomycetota bacterium]
MRAFVRHAFAGVMDPRLRVTLGADMDRRASNGCRVTIFLAFVMSCATTQEREIVSVPHPAQAKDLAPVEVQRLVDRSGPRELCATTTQADDKSEATVLRIRGDVAEPLRTQLDIPGRLVDACLFESGVVVAAYYANRLPAEERRLAFGIQQLDTVGMRVWNAQGEIVQSIEVRRKGRRISHTTPYPEIVGVDKLEWSHMALVRFNEGLLQSGGASWWAFETRFGGLYNVFLPSQFDAAAKAAQGALLNVTVWEDEKLIAVVWSNEEITKWVGDEPFGDALTLFSFEAVPAVVWSRSLRRLWPDGSAEDRVGVIGVEHGRLRLKRLDGPEYLMSIERFPEGSVRARLDPAND